ncbi:hypothetical protein [Providencia phage Kokobel2]|nr:hypothetical protein [Providencia phage Kokobel2]
MKKLIVPIYGSIVRVFASVDEYTKYYGVAVGDDSYEAFVSTLQRGTEISHAVVFSGISTMTAATISHESVHIAWRVLDRAGVKVDVDNHEALSYLVGWFAEKINDYRTQLTSK